MGGGNKFMGNDDHYKYGLESEKDHCQCDGYIKILEKIKGTLNYISVQATANHSGFNSVAKMNADNAIRDINKILPQPPKERG